ncbi:NAD(P)-dependent oxidoreductase [Oculatella sp. LEGE 06141]|uniref:NAD-dependent epimerase/dehydratase family protein n=1 Tax=Oculatella sp. LEGE 06141 TaxID=1828648 RepID=UPI0018828DB1|nr:NAD(P)-dependent oxidoreductase [Oculatella sp. LEGE 06141]MBE9179774.1 NAD(P)-dependent oxidoreductase [Oculatella sp. LEGE 06141]
MNSKRILVTGASGCIGHYIVDALIHQTDYELFLLVRDPAKLRIDYNARPGVTLLQADLRNIDYFAKLLKTIDCAVLTAAAWGGTQESFDINVAKTVRLMNLLDPNSCEQVIYFSTASILGRDNQPLKQAGQIGTDYIKSKYICYQQLSKLAIAPRITTLLPTLVFGGDGQKPYSHLSGGLSDVTKWVNLVRFFKADGSFHFIHAQDIAQVVVHLAQYPPEPGQPRQMILGNSAITVNQAVAEVCAYFNKRIYFRVPLSLQLANLFIALFRIQMAAWDRFCLTYRHFTYQNPVNPASFGLPCYSPTVADLFKVSGIPSQRSSP